MKKQLRDAWVTALRSGEYKQCQGSLQKNDAYCCMGVLCEVAEKIGFAPAKRAEREPSRLQGNYLTAQPVEKELPYGADDTLARMNDNEGKSFPQIATWIEANIPAE